MSKSKSMDAEAWIFLGCCVALLVAYFAPVPVGVVRALGGAVAAVCIFFTVRYAIGDSKGRDWRGLFLPLAVAIAGVKLLIA